MMPILYVVLALILIAIVGWLANNSRIWNAPVSEPPLAVRGAQIRRITNLVLLLIAIGIFLWVVNTFIPMAESIKAILNIVVVAATCVLVLKVAGLWDEIVNAWNQITRHRFTH